LLAELSPAAAARLDADTLAARLRDDRVRVIVGTSDGRVVSTATLTLLTTLTDGLVGRVEDVVVSEAARGSGIGRKVMEALHDEARRCGVVQLDLTSRPGREAANALYQSLGYERRETNVYRLTLD
jgi:ribosomal protein S18 acetylase RimI-like enzyme